MKEKLFVYSSKVERLAKSSSFLSVLIKRERGFDRQRLYRVNHLFVSGVKIVARENITQVIDQLVNTDAKKTTKDKSQKGDLAKKMEKIKEIIERRSKGKPSTKLRNPERLLVNSDALKESSKDFKKKVSKENKELPKLNKYFDKSNKTSQNKGLYKITKLIQELKNKKRGVETKKNLPLKLMNLHKGKSINVSDNERKTKSRQKIEQLKKSTFVKTTDLNNASNISKNSESIAKGKIIAQVIKQIQRTASNSTTKQNIQIGGVSIDLESLKMFEFKDVKRIKISLTVEGERIQIAASQDKGGINVQVQTNSKETETRLEHTMRDIRSEFRERGLDVQTELNSREKREEKEGEGQKEQGNFRQEEDEHASEREEENDGFDRKH